ncbi:MAG: hypothetical protein NC320_10995 [Clostridium sp.]|nr:hypothetical protein [Clostridium sp.]MCM1548166.1 hypothetical protein [Ruminococcus sp.]
MKTSVSYEPTGYIIMSKKRMLIKYVLKGAILCILIIGAMFYHHHKVDPIALIAALAIFAVLTLSGYMMRLNTRFCWNDDKFTVLNFTGNPEKEFNWDDLKSVYTNDENMMMSLLFDENGKDKEVPINMTDDGVNDLLEFLDKIDPDQTEDIK